MWPNHVLGIISRMKTASVFGVVFFVMVLCAVVWQLFHSHTPWLSLLVVGLVIGWGVQRVISYRKDKRETLELADWRRRLDAVVDVRDFRDDGHFYEYFEPDERERLIQELERMPRGSRSLRQAVKIVNPDIVDDDA